MASVGQHRFHGLVGDVLLGAAVLVAVVRGVQLGTVALSGVMLLCPLAMLVMMGAMSASGHTRGHPGQPERDATP